MTYKDPDYMKKYYQKNKQKIDEYSKAYSKNWYQRNKAERQKKHREWFDKHPGAIRDMHLKRKFKITLTQYNDMLSRQSGVCAICHRPERVKHGKWGKTFELSVDHNHKTGEVRGLLCSTCNRAIGLFEDDVELLKAAILYLENHRNICV